MAEKKPVVPFVDRRDGSHGTDDQDCCDCNRAGFLAFPVNLRYLIWSDGR
jgi:hypothetical protein